MALKQGEKSLVSFSDSFVAGQPYVLVELTAPVAKELSAVGGRLYLKGDDDDEVVLCTSSGTFQVRNSETSNTCLILPPHSEHDGDLKGTISGSASSVLELKQINPLLGRLDSHLEPVQITLQMIDDFGLESSESGQGRWNDLEGQFCGVNGILWSNLVSEIQASESEIRAGLEAIPALEIAGYWYAPTEEAICAAIVLLIQSIRAEAIDLSNVPSSFVASTLDDCYPPAMAELAAKLTADFVENEMDNEDNEDDNLDDGKYALSPQKIAKWMARKLLVEQAEWSFAEFQKKWMALCHTNVELPEELLISIGIVSGEGLGMTVTRPPKMSSLSPKARDRFRQLFEWRAQWDQNQMLPFIKDVVQPDQKADSLFVQYCRSCNKGGVKILTRR